MAIFRSLTPLVEPMSLDEAYLDVTQAVATQDAEDLARALKARVRNETGLGLSVGVATCKAVAKIASDMRKPNGLVVVPPGMERMFLAPLPVRQLGGIGPRSEESLHGVGITTLGQLAAQTDAWLAQHFGKRGPELGACARGDDPRPVTPEREVKSISAETTFPRDLSDREALGEIIDRLSQRVMARMEEAPGPGRTVTLKLRLADFTTFTRSITVPIPPTTAEALAQIAKGILEKELGPGRRFRLLGVSLSGFAAGHPDGTQSDLPNQKGQPVLFNL
jgi:DNA polymerase-4